jgi:hypothetical protein
MNKFKTTEEFDMAFENMDLDEAYANFIMANAPGDRCISNGDQLLESMEDEYLLLEFQNSLLDNPLTDVYCCYKEHTS